MPEEGTLQWRGKPSRVIFRGRNLAVEEKIFQIKNNKVNFKQCIVWRVFLFFSSMQVFVG